MSTSVEVFAEITCPFAYVGIRHVVDHVAALQQPVDVVIRAWPLEWVNGEILAVDGVLNKASALREQLGVDMFNGLSASAWPSTTVPALSLASAAYDRDVGTGLAVSLALRSELFERGADISDRDVLRAVAAAHGVEFEAADERAVRAEYEDGLSRGVTGSPHYFVDDDDFFCPALELGRDAEEHLIARFDPDGLARFLASVEL